MPTLRFLIASAAILVSKTALAAAPLPVMPKQFSGVKDPVPAIVCTALLRFGAHRTLLRYGLATTEATRASAMETARSLVRLSEAIATVTEVFQTPEQFAAAHALVLQPISEAEREKRNRYCVALAGEVAESADKVPNYSYVIQAKLGELLRIAAEEGMKAPEKASDAGK